MNAIKKSLAISSFLLLLHTLLCSTINTSQALDFLDRDRPKGTSILQRDAQIPIGIAHEKIHYLHVQKGMPLHEIAPKVSQRRQQIGLQPQIPLAHRDQFFHNFSWKMAKDIAVKAPTAAYIMKVHIQNGQNFEAGAKLCKIEVMKMEIVIRSPARGRANYLYMKAGDVVPCDFTLLDLLPDIPEWEDINQTEILDNMEIFVHFFPWESDWLNNGHSVGISHLAKTPSRKQDEATNGAQESNLQGETLLFSSFLSKSNLFSILASKVQKAPALHTISPSTTFSPFFSDAQYSTFTPPIMPPSQRGKTDIHSIQEEKSPSIRRGSSPAKLTASLKETPVPNQNESTEFSIVTWGKWLSGLVALTHLIFVLQSWQSPKFRRSQSRKLHAIEFTTPRMRSLHGSDFNKPRYTLHQKAHNMNRKAYYKMKRA